MTHIFQSISQRKEKWITTYIQFSQRHPCLSFFCLFSVMPIFILITVFATVSAIFVPLGWLLGWL